MSRLFRYRVPIVRTAGAAREYVEVQAGNPIAARLLARAITDALHALEAEQLPPNAAELATAARVPDLSAIWIGEGGSCAVFL